MVVLNYFWLTVLLTGMIAIGYVQGYRAGLKEGHRLSEKEALQKRDTKPEGCYCHETLKPDQPFGGYVCPVCEMRLRTRGEDYG